MSELITQRLYHLHDNFLMRLKNQWFTNSHPVIGYQKFIPIADAWFKSSKINTLVGWNEFSNIDVTMGCTHFIESLLIKHSRQIQVLPNDYAYYGLMGIHGTPLGSLRPEIPLIVSLPNWKAADIRSDWSAVLSECESKNIDIHIDMAWMTIARDIELDLTHPCIKSFAMSISKYSIEWNRVGLRWSRQRTMDPITMFNHYQGDINSSATSCGAFIMDQLPRDYAWETYRDKHFKICKDYHLTPTKMIHVAKQQDQVVGIARLLDLDSSTPNQI
jgi:hypothetical protein